MPNYKLTYFNYDGLGEPIRWVFKVAGVDFEDEKISFKDWPAAKASGRFPIGSAPLLEVDGVTYTQSDAILRYVASLHGLASTDPHVTVKLDQILGILGDARAGMRPTFFEPDAAKKEALKKELVEVKLPALYKHMEDIIKTSGGTFVGGSKATYADFALVVHMGVVERVLSFNFKDCSTLAKLRDSVQAIPQIAAWLKVRPDFESF